MIRSLASRTGVLLAAACTQLGCGGSEPATPDESAQRTEPAAPRPGRPAPPRQGDAWRRIEPGTGIAVHLDPDLGSGEATWVETNGRIRANSTGIQAALGPGGELDVGFHVLHFNSGLNGILSASPGADRAVGVVRSWIDGMGQGVFVRDLEDLRGHLWIGAETWSGASRVSCGFDVAGEERGETVRIRGGGGVEVGDGLVWMSFSPEGMRAVPSVR